MHLKYDGYSVCIAAPAMAPIIGGAETFAEVLTLALTRADVTVHLLTSEKPRQIVFNEIKRVNGSVNILGSTFGPCNGSYMFFENRNIDIILSYQGFTMFFGVLFSWL